MPIRIKAATVLVSALLVSPLTGADPAAPVTTPAAGAATPAPASPPAATAPDAGSRSCLRDTGTRIKLRPGQCSHASGRVHAADDLRDTGQPSAADALRNVDPSVTATLGR